MEPIPICPPPPLEMKGGTGMTNPKLSTLLLMFRHERRLRLTALCLTTPCVSPLLQPRCGQALPSTVGHHKLQGPPAAHELF